MQNKEIFAKYRVQKQTNRMLFKMNKIKKFVTTNDENITPIRILHYKFTEHFLLLG